MDKYLNWIKDHKYLGFIVFVGVVVIGVGNLTDAVTKIKGFVAPYIVRTESVYLTLKVHNQTEKDINLTPYVKYYITHPIAVIPTWSPTGMLVLPDDNNETDNLIINSGERKTYYVPLPEQLAKSHTINQGNTNISFLIDLDEEYETQIGSIPFMKDSFERYYVEFKITPKVRK